MADTHGLFWNSNNGDRVYDADSFAEWLAPFFDNGVLIDSFTPSAGSGMSVTVSSGTGFINGRLRTVDESTTLTIETASATYPRIDNIVLESNISNREITLKVVKGTYSTTATATAPTRTNDIYQLVIARVKVNAGATSISASDITDCREDTSLCGYISAVLGSELQNKLDEAIETAQEAKEAAESVVSQLADYVVEDGNSSTLGLDTSMFMTSGAHIYWQKWNSGKLEIWGNVTCSINAYVQTSSWGSGYSSDYFTCWGKWPVAFVNNPIVDVQMMGADNDNYTGDYMLLFKGMNSEDNSVLTHSPKFKFWRGTTKIFGHPKLAFRAVGQWK